MGAAFNVEGHWLLAWLRPADAMKPTVFCQDDWFVMGWILAAKTQRRLSLLQGR